MSLPAECELTILSRSGFGANGWPVAGVAKACRVEFVRRALQRVSGSRNRAIVAGMAQTWPDQ